MAVAVCLCLAAVACSEQINALAGENGIAMEYETALFDTDEAMQVNILMDEDEWKEMLENAIEEEYYSCDVEINGKTFYKVGIRPKGNTSLSSIASDPTTDRYSFKLEFDHYVEGQRWNEQGERPEMGQGAAPDDRNQMPGGMEAAAPSGVSSNLIWSAISFGVLVLALLFAVLFKRRPRRR